MRSICVLLGAVAVAMSPASANVITIGSGNAAPDVFTKAGLNSGANVYDSGVQPFSFADGTNGVYEEVVAPIGNNPFCANCLGFGLLVELNADSPFDLSTARFGLWNSSTDVGYCSDCGGGTIIPNTVFRGTGNNVGFNFSGSTFAPGDTTELLGVLTNATQFWVRGSVFFNDTNGATSNTFGSIAIPTPEPSTLVLTGFAIAGLAGVRRRPTR